MSTDSKPAKKAPAKKPAAKKDPEPKPDPAPETESPRRWQASLPIGADRMSLSGLANWWRTNLRDSEAPTGPVWLRVTALASPRQAAASLPKRARVAQHLVLALSEPDVNSPNVVGVMYETGPGASGEGYEIGLISDEVFGS